MINSWKLGSQAQLVIEEIPYVKSAAIGVFIKVGSRHETPEIAGGSHFIEHMLFKGTEQRNAREIAESFESIGGQLNAYTSKEYTCVYARTLDENIYTATEIIFDMLFNSVFEAKEFSTEKEVVIEEINMYEDNPDDLIHDVFAQKMWAGHTMGLPILGTLDSVTNFSRDNILDFYHKCYTPSNMVIAIAGNVETEKMRDKIEDILNKVSGQQVALPSLPPQQYNRFTSLVEKDTEQVQICWGVPGLNYHDPGRYALNIMNSILGGGLSSRLFQSLREELGLAYSIYSSSSAYSDTGACSIYIGTGPGKIERCQEALYEQIMKFGQEGVTDIEVQRTQQMVKSSMYMGMESVMNRMSRLGKSILMYGRVIPIEEVMENVMKVKYDEVNQLAAKILVREKFSMAAIGTKEALSLAENEYTKHWT
ncbi:MAG: pitrilysin family protein [Syntrophomonadaceae bacterium]|nr:pitrilysin family protein [Syntrophomonadaceae bacterium]